MSTTCYRIFRPSGSDENSDAHARPDQVVQQILSIAPVLPGQKPGQHNTTQQKSSTAQRSAPAPAPSKSATASAPSRQPPTTAPFQQPPTAMPSQHLPTAAPIKERVMNQQPQIDSLIDFGGHSQPQASSIPQSQPQAFPSYSNQRTGADPIAGNPLHPTSNPKQIAPIYDSITSSSSNAPKSSSLMDDNYKLNDQMGSMSMQQPLYPTSSADGRPIKRMDTETSDTEVFVDAQS